MSKVNKNNGGLLVCGASAVIVDANRCEPTSVDRLVDGIKRITSKVFSRS